MHELRAAKLVSATLLICSGAVCIAIGDLIKFQSAGVPVGLVLLAFGIPMLIRQWTSEGLLTHARNGWRRLLWTPWLSGDKAADEEPVEARSR